MIVTSFLAVTAVTHKILERFSLIFEKQVTVACSHIFNSLMSVLVPELILPPSSGSIRSKCGDC